MDEADSLTLLKAGEYITENLDAKYILDQLIEREVLDTDQDDEIREEPTPKRRTEKLLEILPNTRHDALKHLKEVLEKDYQHIAEKLRVSEELGSGATADTGEMLTAAASSTKVASKTDQGITTTRTTRNNVTSRTTNIRGNDNFVIIGGKRTTINHYR